MPNVTRGEDIQELIRYLYGPGRANEHTDPHLVAASADIIAPGAPRFEGKGELAYLSAELDGPHTLFRTKVPGGHVWHCSLSIPPEDGQLTGEQWHSVAQRVVDGMGFAEESGKAPCRWVAVRHGLSVNGNDHIHLVVNLVRTDGTKADVWRDRPRVQAVCGQIERDMGLRIVEGRASGRTMPGIKPGEREAAARRGQPEPARLTLARRVRAAAATAESEADFVLALRESGVIARPRYAKDDRTEVVGYSVALHTDGAEAPVWYGGGKLARDLTLSKLREQWPDSDAGEAIAVWGARGAGQRRSVGNPMLRDESAWQVAAEQIQQVREQLAAVPAGDTVRWAQAAHEAAGVLAVLSARMEPARPGPLARAADVLARSAQRTTDTRREAAELTGQLKGAAMVARYARTGGAGSAGELAFLLALRNTMRALHQMHKARQERDQALRIEASAQGDLRRLQQTRQALSQSPGAGPARGSEPGRSVPWHPDPQYPAPERDGTEYGR